MTHTHTHTQEPTYPTVVATDSKREVYMIMYTLEELENMLYSQKKGEDLELIMEVMAEREAWEESHKSK